MTTSQNDHVSTKATENLNFKMAEEEFTKVCCKGAWIFFFAPIHYFPIVHNALCLPPKFCINYCCEILLRGLHISKSIPQQ